MNIEYNVCVVKSLWNLINFHHIMNVHFEVWLNNHFNVDISALITLMQTYNTNHLHQTSDEITFPMPRYNFSPIIHPTKIPSITFALSNPIFSMCVSFYACCASTFYYAFCYIQYFFPKNCKEQKPVYRGPTKFSRESSSYYVISRSNVISSRVCAKIFIMW